MHLAARVPTYVSGNPAGRKRAGALHTPTLSIQNRSVSCASQGLIVCIFVITAFPLSSDTGWINLSDPFHTYCEFV